ncbi:MAG TPA: hypothetical protein VI565_10605, partial [Burkholderiales bacterium]|nr:hypothetical protein [Burkholderiales bacterium]
MTAPEQYVTADSVTQYRRLLRYVWPYKWIFLTAIAGMAVLSGTSAGFAALMKPLVDHGLVAR